MCYQDDSDGSSVLMHAAAQGSLDAVVLLLNHGAPWNALDRANRCAGEYAIEQGHEEVAQYLLEAGCRAELILMAAEKHSKLGVAPTGANDAYLSQKLEYVGDVKLLDEGKCLHCGSVEHVRRSTHVLQVPRLSGCLASAFHGGYARASSV